MAENDLTKKYFEEEYGVTAKPVIDVYPLDNYTQITNDGFVSANSILRDLPFFIAQYNAEQKAVGTYRVIFDKGLGTLQQSAANPERFRANVVEFGTNNKITGQAELEKFQLKVRTPALAVFEVASIITNQYYLHRIDKELTQLHLEVKNVVQILEDTKESELCAREQSLQSVSDNLANILQKEDYRKSTLNNVQGIRMNAFALVEYYYRERIRVLTSWSKKKSSKTSYVQEFLDQYQNKLDLYSRAFHVYSLAYVIEVLLAQITEADSINLIKEEIQSVALKYNQEYEGNFAQFNTRAMENNENIVKGLGTHFLGGAAGGAVAGLVGMATLPVAGLVFGSILAGNALKDKKAERAMKLLKDGLLKIEDSYNRNSRVAEKAVIALDKLNRLYNNKVELLVIDDEIYMKNK